MNPQLHARVGEAFIKARALEGDQREAFLQTLDDRSLRAEVESLLASDPGQHDGFLAHPLMNPLQLAVPSGARGGREDREGGTDANGGDESVSFLSSGNITLASGVYRIVGILGEGGSSVVYRAEQLSPLRRTVAIKVLHRAEGRPDAMARFEAECQAAARMQHAGIATLFDAGLTRDGHPLVVMEEVPGLPVTEYCRKRDPGLRERLGLFLQIASAVAHAHQKGVVHRDLKPSNILVADPSDAHVGRAPLPPPPAPVVKVIDFGIAKSIGGGGGRLHSATFATSHGQLLGTLAYMSPEQLAGDPAQVDVRSDIYTLGAVLEEMLTGVPAVDVGSLDLPSAIRRIEQGRPSRPARPSPFARARGIADRPGAMPRDLHLIIGKAMAREPARRYQSVTELAADVERFLESRPVLARAPGPLYITLRFARRHKALAASGTVALLALVVSAIWVVQEQRRAERYYRISRDTATFLLRELVEPLNDHLGIREVHKDLLQQALRRTEAFSRQEAADFDVQHARAVIIAALADIAEAEQRHEDAHRMVDEVLGLRQRLADEEPGDRTRQADLSVAIVRKGDQVAKLGGPRAALPHYMRALAIDERLHAADPTHPRFASNLAWSYDRLGALYRQLDEFETSLGYFHRNVRFLDRLESLNVKRDDLARCLASSHTHLSIIARARGDFETALQHARRAQVVAEEALNVAANSRVAALSSGAAWTTLGVALIDLGRYAEALQCFEGMHRDVFPIFERSPGDRAVRSHYLAAAAWGGRLAIDLQDAEAASNWKERWRTVAGSLEHWPPPNKLGTFR